MLRLPSASFLLVAACGATLTGCGSLTPLNIGALNDTAADTDTDTDADVDTDVDTDTDADTTPPGLHPPTLVEMTAASVGAEIEIGFTAQDADNDLVDGAFEITANGAVTAFAIPYDLATWSAATGSGTFRFPAPATSGGGGTPCGGGGGGGSGQVALIGRVVDATDLRSGTKSAVVTVGGGGGGGGSTTVPEVGDLIDDVAALGTISVPCTLSSDMYASGGAAGYVDIDVMSFTLTASAGLVTVTPSNATDLDVELYDDTGYLVRTLLDDNSLALATGFTTGVAPESLATLLLPNTNYYLLVGAWDGPGGAYTVQIQ